MGLPAALQEGPRKWLQGYLNEFRWRYNPHDQRDPAMFSELIMRAAQRWQPKNDADRPL